MGRPDARRVEAVGVMSDNGGWRNRIVALEEHKPEEIADHPYQWRSHGDHQRAAIRGVLDEVGIAGALLVYESDATGQLTAIDGHLRKGLDPDVAWPCLVLDVNDAEAAKLLATVDPIAALAGAEAEALEALLATMETEDEALQKMLEELAENAGIVPELAPAPEAQMDRAAELQEKWQTATGQVWGMGAYTVCPKCGKVHNLD